MELEKRKTPKKRNDYGGCLSEDLIFDEILPRLPTESLTRFKLVSKRWLLYIRNDERLISNHLLHSSRATKLSIILFCNFGKHTMHFLDHTSGYKVAAATDVALYMKNFAGSFGRSYVIGSCNGLLCMGLRQGGVRKEPLVFLQSNQEAVVLWNPETGEGRDCRLPLLPSSFYVLRRGADLPVFGFGFDRARNDYKVVRIVPVGPPAALSLDVFSRNSGLWRRKEPPLLGYTVCNDSSHSVHLDGCLYWLVLGDDGRRRVLSLGLRDEQVRIIDLPPAADPVALQLAKLKENCLVCLSFPAQRQQGAVGIRVVLDNGNENDSVVESRAEFGSGSEGYYWKFCGVSRDRFFVAEREAPRDGARARGRLVMHDAFGRDYEDVGGGEEVSGVWGRSRYGQAHDYVPSLVSAYPDQKTKFEEVKNMELRYWVDMFWKTLGFTKDEFGISKDR